MGDEANCDSTKNINSPMASASTYARRHPSRNGRVFGVLGATPLIVALVLAVCADQASALHERILERDINALTFSEGQWTTHRRGSAYPQLECKGALCNNKDARPTVIRATNVGWDGQSVQWDFKAALPEGVHFGEMSVQCEGFERAGDAYVLVGSCALEYELRGAVKQTVQVPPPPPPRQPQQQPPPQQQQPYNRPAPPPPTPPKAKASSSWDLQLWILIVIVLLILYAGVQTLGWVVSTAKEVFARAEQAEANAAAKRAAERVQNVHNRVQTQEDRRNSRHTRSNSGMTLVPGPVAYVPSPALPAPVVVEVPVPYGPVWPDRMASVHHHHHHDAPAIVINSVSSDSGRARPCASPPTVASSYHTAPPSMQTQMATVYAFTAPGQDVPAATTAPAPVAEKREATGYGSSKPSRGSGGSSSSGWGSTSYSASAAPAVAAPRQPSPPPPPPKVEQTGYGASKKSR